MRIRPDFSLFLIAAAVVACSDPIVGPSDDPAAYVVDTTVDYDVEIAEPRWIIPSAALPADAVVAGSNNNVEVEMFEDRLFVAWRTSENHWASPNSRLNVISSADDGKSWQFEQSIGLGSDVREPRMLVFNGTLTLAFFEAGTNPAAFEPKAMWRSTRKELGQWSAPEKWGEPGHVPWDLKVRGGRALLTTYVGTHYDLGAPDIQVHFLASTDGRTFSPVKSGGSPVYRGGVSEVAFELDETGALWAVTRNEDGDASGYGSHLCTAPANNLGKWTCPAKSNPERYDSPEMFRHGDDLYLLARRDIGGPFDQGDTELSESDRRRKYLVDYWNRPKRTALYKIDRENKRIVHIQDLPSAGDTAFPSVRRTGAHTFIVANYTSPLDQPDVSWVQGQASDRGTQIYLTTLTFRPR